MSEPVVTSSAADYRPPEAVEVSTQHSNHTLANHSTHSNHMNQPGESPLGQSLEPLVCAACDGKLGPIRWFKSTWQRGGGSTGFATFRLENGSSLDAVVKLPVGYTELKWTRALGATDGPTPTPTPRVLASGTSLGPYDLGWLVIERVPGRPLAAELSERDVHDMLAAAAQVQMLLGRHGPVTGAAPKQDFAKMIEKSKDAVRRGQLVTGHEAHLWATALRHVAHALPALLTRWNARPMNSWCHGDLHAGNAMRRADGSCVLIDLALVHPGHWVEDAIYFERVYWGHEAYLHGIHVVSELAAQRRRLGLPCDGDYGMIAAVRRVLSAAAAPALMEREGNPKYLHAALAIIDRYLPMVGH